MHLPHMSVTAKLSPPPFPFKCNPKSFFFFFSYRKFSAILKKKKSTRNGRNRNIHLYWHFRKRKKNRSWSPLRPQKGTYRTVLQKSLAEGVIKIWIGNRMASTSINYGSSHFTHVDRYDAPTVAQQLPPLATVFTTLDYLQISLTHLELCHSIKYILSPTL